jgi:hypothetical protein
MVKEIIDIGGIEPTPDSATEYACLLDRLRGSIEREHVSMIDSNAYAIAVFLEENPGFIPEEEKAMKMEALNAIIKSAWQTPDWPQAVARLSVARIDSPEL